MAVTVVRQNDDMQKMFVTPGWTTDTTEKLAGRVGRHARLFDEDEDEIEDCMICGQPSKEVLCVECTHEQFAWKGVGKGAPRWALPWAQLHSFLSRLVSRRSSLERGLLTTGSQGIRICIYICIYIFM